MDLTETIAASSGLPAMLPGPRYHPRMGLYVVGMHRSGTSAITEALASLPFDLPDSEAMLGGNESNPRGHWEVTALTEFNQYLLERVGASWLAPLESTLPEMERLGLPELSLDSKAQRLFTAAFSSDDWLFKDPRLSLTLPFWRRVLGPSPAVLVLRDPMAIARSLRARNGFALPFGLALWERYLRSAVKSLEGMHVHVTSFADIAGGGQPVVDLIEFASETFAKALPDDFDGMAHRASEAIDPSLRHQDGGPDVDLSLLSPQQADLQKLLLAARGTHAHFSVDLSDTSETPGLELAFSSAASLDAEAERTLGEREAKWVSDFEQSRTKAREDFTNAENRWRGDYEELTATVRAKDDAFEETADVLVSEIDRLRDLLALAETYDVSGAAARRQLEHDLTLARNERDTAVHERNISVQESSVFLRRRAVRYPVKVADGLRKLGLLAGRNADEPAVAIDPEPSAPAVPAHDGAPFVALADAIQSGLFDRPLTVIMPIYNAAEAVQRAIQALRRFTPDSVRLVFVDDASPDPRIARLLEPLDDAEHITVLTNPENLGFTRTVNRGLAHVREANGGDVIILNSDTIVTPRWSQRLRSVAHEDPAYATVTPLSNAAGAFSFSSPLPTGSDEAARLSAAVAEGARYLRPTGPTGNGFCLFIKAEALDEVRELDGDAFPRGYGEENDFSMKLGAAGFTHVVADEIAIFHEESASFGDAAKTELIEQGLAVLDERYPEYRSTAQAFVDSTAFVTAKANATAAIAAAADQPHPRTRVLSVLHDGGGGTEYHVSDLVNGLRDEYEPWVLIPAGNDLVLWTADDPAQRVEIARWSLSSPWDLRRFHNPEVAAVMAELLTRYNIDLVHIQHLIGHSLDMPRTARALGIPTALTLHDFYMACPSVNLLDENRVFCGGTCTAGDGPCQTPVWLDDDFDLKHRFVHMWRDETRKILEEVDVLITPSEDTKDHFVKIFGPEVGGRIHAIEHGRDFDRPRAFARVGDKNEAITILLVGAINQSKGAALAAEVARIGSERNVSVQLLGNVEPGYEDNVLSHGPYVRDDLPLILAQLRPTFVGVFSIWAETHCYVVSEAWAAGVPVLVGPLGAPAERVRNHGGGVIVPSLEPSEIIDAALKAARDRTGYATLASEASLSNVRTVAEMANDYRNLYSELLARKGAFSK